MQGILIVDKPMEWTSFDVIAKLRGILGTRKLGHSGTLDPMATGVLPVFCGGASKAVDLQLDHTKTYCARLRLGMQTDTGDITGTVLETAPVTAGEKELLAVLPRFLGPQMQTPPMYSASRWSGRPAPSRSWTSGMAAARWRTNTSSPSAAPRERISALCWRTLPPLWARKAP